MLVPIFGRLVSDEIFFAVMVAYVSDGSIIAWELPSETIPCRCLDYHKSKQIYEAPYFSLTSTIGPDDSKDVNLSLDFIFELIELT